MKYHGSQSNLNASLKESITWPCDCSPLLCIVTILSNSRASGVPEAS